MRLYSLTGVTHLNHQDHGEFDADENGAFDLPEELGAHLHRFPDWEDDAERSERLAAAEAERRKDPATLLAAVEQLVAAQAEPKRPRKAASAKPRS